MVPALLKGPVIFFSMMPSELIIQNRISEPTSGVMIIGSSEKKITGPLRRLGTMFTARAMAKPRRMASGVTTKV